MSFVIINSVCCIHTQTVVVAIPLDYTDTMFLRGFSSESRLLHGGRALSVDPPQFVFTPFV